MRKNRKGQSGQAIAELLAGIIGLSAAFLGMLFVAALGLSNVENLIKARGTADLAACTRTASSSSGAQSLAGWSSGDDGLYFTQDDKPVPGGEEDAWAFTGQMVSDSPEYDLTDGVIVGNSTYESSFVDLDTGSFFVNAGGLVAGSESDADPLQSRGLDDLKEALNTFLGFDPAITLSETMYMPSLYNGLE